MILVFSLNLLTVIYITAAFMLFIVFYVLISWYIKNRMLAEAPNTHGVIGEAGENGRGEESDHSDQRMLLP